MSRKASGGSIQARPMAANPPKSQRKQTGPSLLARRRAKIRLGGSPISASAPPVRILGTGRRYRGGYRVQH
jgi:hypothetical protein